VAVLVPFSKERDKTVVLNGKLRAGDERTFMALPHKIK